MSDYAMHPQPRYVLDLTNENVPESALGAHECGSCHTVDLCWSYDQGPHCYLCASREEVASGN